MESYWKHWWLALLLFPLIMILIVAGLGVSNWVIAEIRTVVGAQQAAQVAWTEAKEADDAAGMSNAAARQLKNNAEMEVLIQRYYACNWFLFGLTIPLAWVTWQLTTRVENSLETAGRFAALALPPTCVAVTMMPDAAQRWTIVQVLGILIWLGMTAVIQKVAAYLGNYLMLSHIEKGGRVMNLLVILTGIIYFNPGMIPPLWFPWITSIIWGANILILTGVTWVCVMLARQLRERQRNEEMLLSPSLQVALIQEWARQQSESSDESF